MRGCAKGIAVLIGVTVRADKGVETAIHWFRGSFALVKIKEIDRVWPWKGLETDEISVQYLSVRQPSLR